MKIKLLLAPSLVVVTIILLIWFVYPAYTNPSAAPASPSVSGSTVAGGANDGAKELYGALQEERGRLSQADERIAHAKSLFTNIAANGDKKEALYAFIPDSYNEEELIDMLNYLAGKADLSVINISVTPAKEDLSPVEAGAATAAASTPSQTMASMTAKDVEVNFVVMGGYDQVKNVIGKIYLLKRFNKLTNVSIIPVTNADGNQDGNILQVNLTLYFNMLKRPAGTVSAENPVFANVNFDMTPIGNIQASKDGEILKLESGPLGTVPNPFLP